MVNNNHVARQILLKTNSGFKPIKKKSENVNIKSEKSNFDKMLQRKMLQDEMQLKFSKHAQKRLASRNIELSSVEIGKINKAVETARAKGSKDSLVLLKDLALVVSVKNNTVITAVNDEAQKENVFTNIDSAVIAK